MMDREWQLQDAKARLSEVVQSAQTQGPQHITVRGRRAVVLISEKEFQRLQKQKPRFMDFIRQSPLVGIELDLTRDKSPAREIDL
jgi:antitoxin Phd